MVRLWNGQIVFRTKIRKPELIVQKIASISLNEQNLAPEILLLRLGVESGLDWGCTRDKKIALELSNELVQLSEPQIELLFWSRKDLIAFTIF
jgi:hypothetical protein